LRILKNRVLMRIFKPRRDGVTGGRRKLKNEKLHNLFSSNISVINSRRMKWTGNVARMGEMRNAYNTSVGKS
jgi:hypothetical protein